MKIYLGSDHRGFELKENLKEYLKRGGVKVEDCGADVYDQEDDYVDYAQSVAQKVSENKETKGILICGSAHGVDIVANRFKKVRSIIGYNCDVVIQGREHEDANVLCLPSEWINQEEAQDMVKVFLETQFSGEQRHQRRLEKLKNLEV